MQPKKLKILVKIWGVWLRKMSKSEKNFYAKNIIEWAEKWFATKKVENFENFGSNLGCLTEKNFFAQNIIEWAEKWFATKKV